MITFVYQNVKSDAAAKFLDILHDFDTRAECLEVKMNMESERKGVVRTMVWMAGGICAVSFGSALTFKLQSHYGARFTLPLSYGYVLLYLSLLILQFSFATMAIKSRFRVLNDNLRFTYQHISARRCTAINIRAIGYSEQLPNIITDLYSNLCDSIDLVNDSFTFQLIPFAVYFLTANMFGIYSIIRETFYRTPLMVVAILMNTWWILLHTVIISIAVHSSYTATKCALRTPIIVSSILKSCKWRDEKCVILLEFQYRNVFFENEFFRIDWKLLFSVSSTNTLS
jgi:hypothetical protein